MKKYIEERVIEIANYIIDNKATVRKAGEVFGISKSTVHKDITERIFEVNVSLGNEIKDILNDNKNMRHIRGGQATKEKYLRERKGQGRVYHKK